MTSDEQKERIMDYSKGDIAWLLIFFSSWIFCGYGWVTNTGTPAGAIYGESMLISWSVLSIRWLSK